MEINEINTIEQIAINLAPSFVFGIHQLDDIKQEITLFGLQILDRYEYGTQDLYEFLYRHIRNRMLCWKRNQIHRMRAIV